MNIDDHTIRMCGRCEFFAPQPFDRFEGQCRVSPPMLQMNTDWTTETDDDGEEVLTDVKISQSETRWPGVNRDEWCGAFRLAET